MESQSHSQSKLKILKQLSTIFKKQKPKPKLKPKERKIVHKCSSKAIEEIKVTSRCPHCSARKSICYIHLDTEGASEEGFECEKCGRGLITGYRSLGGPHTCKQKPNFSARRR